MTFYSEADLIALIRAGESDQCEFKRNAKDLDAIRRNICAFANDLPNLGKPGLIIVGLEDDGKCADLEITDEILNRLSNAVTDGSVQAVPAASVHRLLIDGCDVAVVQVEPSSRPPVRYGGRVWVRVGPTLHQASLDVEQILIEKRRHEDSTFDQSKAIGATLDDLDLDYIRSFYLPQAVSPEVLSANQRTFEEQLRSLHLLDGDVPTIGAIVAMGIDPLRWVPGGYMQFLRIAGSDITDPISDRKELTGRLDDILQRLDSLIRAHVFVSTDIASSAREQQRPNYPIEALRQIAFNAIMHRDYPVTNEPARFYWYFDRIEIRNPGGLVGGLTEADIDAGKTGYRNPLIAEAMYHLGYAQRFGTGIPTARRRLAENGNPEAQFEFGLSHTLVTIRPAR